MGSPRRPHVVPAGYQRLFARKDGRVHRIRLVPKRSAETTPSQLVSVRDAFVRSGFLTVQTADGPTDQAEDEFSRVESNVLAVVRQIDVSAVTDADRAAARAIVALLLARSFRLELMGRRVGTQAIEETMARAMRDRRLPRLFERGTGRPPRPGELEATLRRVSDRFVSSGAGHVIGMMHTFNSGLDFLQRFNVEFLSAAGSSYGFVTGDNPVVIARGEGMVEVDSDRTHFAIGDAQVVYAPIRRDLGVSLTTNANWAGRIGTPGVVSLNNAMWRGSFRFIGAHPDEDWQRACGGVASKTGFGGDLGADE